MRLHGKNAHDKETKCVVRSDTRYRRLICALYLCFYMLMPSDTFCANCAVKFVHTSMVRFIYSYIQKRILWTIGLKMKRRRSRQDQSVI